MINRRIGAFLLAAMTAFVLPACGGSSGGAAATTAAPAATTAAAAAKEETTAAPAAAASGDVIQLKLGHGQTEAHPYHLGAQKFADLVKEYSNGTIEVTIYPNATLGAERDMVEGVSMGTVDMTITTNAPLTNFDSSFNVFEFPFLFETEEEAHKVLDSEFGANLMKGLESQNIKGLAFFENGFRNMTNNKHEIKTVDDLKGLKIRTMESEIHIASFKAMGANPTPMAWGEVYTALQQGTIDGQENPAMAIVDGKIYEVNKYLSKTGHFYSPAELLLSNDKFEAMTPEQQEAVLKAAAEACEYQRQQAYEFNVGKLDTLKDNGMIITEVDKSSFREACQAVYDQYDADYGEAIREIQGMLGR